MRQTATLYRMVTDDHVCPFGIKSKFLLERMGYSVEDHPLRSREETDRFKEQHHVDTTPQTFIAGARVGGYERLRDFFGLSPEGKQGETYRPVIAIYGLSFAMALGLAWHVGKLSVPSLLVEWFLALSMCALALQKLRDIPSFTNRFVTYDLLSMKLVPYAYVYPFAEAFVGIGMLAGLPAFVVAPFALLLGVEGAASVYKAVYLDRRDLKCACVGGESNVPLGPVSLLENLLMICAAIWMIAR